MTRLKEPRMRQVHVHNSWLNRGGSYLVLAAALTVSALSYADDNPEMLGVINGSVMQRGIQTELTPFLSGRPLFRYEVDDNQPAITQVLIEQVQLPIGLAQTGEGRFWIQALAELINDSATTAPLQVPVQVNVDGQPVKVMTEADSRGVMVTLPAAARQIIIRPAGSIRLMVPNLYRGDIRADIRMVAVLPAAQGAE